MEKDKKEYKELLIHSKEVVIRTLHYQRYK